MNVRTKSVERRRFLRGLGALVALPTLESLNTQKLYADSTTLGVTKTGSPLRMAFVSFPNGVNLKTWRPSGTGHDFTLGESMAPLADLQTKLQVFTGFEHDMASAHGDGSGSHARASACFLTGVHPLKTAGANIRNGISVDQLAAQKIGHLTRLASLELGTEKTRRSGYCDNGYSCAYQYNASWASESLPMAPEPDPRQVFERLFGSEDGAERQQHFLLRQQQRRSLIDFVLEDVRSLNPQLGANDRRKLDEYLVSVRAVEQQIEKAERFDLPDPTLEKPSGVPKSHSEHIRIMFDLLALAFQTDSTRVATFPLAHEGSNLSFNEIDIPEGHHHLSHHQGMEAKLAKVARIDRFYMEQMAYFLKKIDSMRDSDGKTVLDNSMILYGCAISDGDDHNNDDLPIILAGCGGESLNSGRHVKFSRDVPLTNLYIAMLDRMGVQTEKLGDSDGRLDDL